KPMLVPLPFGLARFKANFLQFAPGALKLTPDQVTLLARDNVVSDAAKAAGLTLEGLGISADSLEAIAPQYLWRFRAAGQFQRKSACLLRVATKPMDPSGGPNDRLRASRDHNSLNSHLGTAADACAATNACG